ncbi:MAG: hypothetical protein J7551_10010 [Chloroflexi bacterium]|jgi:hypothetical protein|nr:hypothetical protein [Chloroflexota bacterium]
MMPNNPPERQSAADELAQVRAYHESVLHYEALDKQIDELLQSAGGRSEGLSDEAYVRYRELAALRDLAYNRMLQLGSRLLDES